MSPGNESHTPSSESPPWEPTACILCECNCGIQVQLGGDDGRQFARIRGDRANPVSKGYVCQKAGRLNHYQNSRDRLLAPMRRRPDGSFEEIDWDTAIREVAARLSDVRDRFGGESIFYYGGGGQGNHLPGFYARSTLRELAKDPERCLIVIDGLVPCNLIADEILSDHPNRYRAMLIESANPVHSLAESRKMREALKALECVVVIDIAMTETARLADYVLPATTQLAILELFEAIEALGRSRGPAITSETFPLVLSAGERRSFTANTIYRDPKWRRKAFEDALTLSPNDAAALEIADGDPARLVTAQGAAEVLTRISDRMQDGHISLPNGLGLDYPDELGERTLDGIAPNELTAATDRDPIAGTPWHKSVPARLERLTDAAA